MVGKFLCGMESVSFGKWQILSISIFAKRNLRAQHANGHLNRR